MVAFKQSTENPKHLGFVVACPSICLPTYLEAQQRYLSYRAILAAIVSQMFSCLFSWGIAQVSRDMLQNGVSDRCACVKLSTKGGGYRTIFGGMLTSLKKYRAIRGIAAIVSQYRAIRGH